MKCLRRVLVTLPMASVMLFAQQADQEAAKPAENATQPASSAQAAPSTQAARPSTQAAASNAMTYKGTIVNADCSSASALTSSRSANYADRGSSAGGDAASSTPKANMDKNPKSVYDLQHDVMRHCAASSKVTSFALLTDDGQFFKLDDTGNTQVKSSDAKTIKNMKVSVAGSLEGDILKVQSLAKI